MLPPISFINSVCCTRPAVVVDDGVAGCQCQLGQNSSCDVDSLESVATSLGTESPLADDAHAHVEAQSDWAGYCPELPAPISNIGAPVELLPSLDLDDDISFLQVPYEHLSDLSSCCDFDSLDAYDPDLEDQLRIWDFSD